jgi:hypothetical protein
MIFIASALQTQFEEYLQKKAIPIIDKNHFSKLKDQAGPNPYKKDISHPLHDYVLSTRACEASNSLNLLGRISVEGGIGASWKDEYSRLMEEIQVRHYSPKTLQTYRGWTQKFQAFIRSKGPELLSSNDVK